MASKVERKATSVPANYVSLAQLQQRWFEQQKHKEKAEEETMMIPKNKNIKVKVDGNGNGNGNGGGERARGEEIVNKCEGSWSNGRIRVEGEKQRERVAKEEEESGKVIGKTKKKFGNGVAKREPRDEEEKIVMVVSEGRGNIAVTLRAVKDDDAYIPVVVAQGKVAGKTLLVAGRSNVSVAVKGDALHLLIPVNGGGGGGQDEKEAHEILREYEDDVMLPMTKVKEVEDKCYVAVSGGIESENKTWAPLGGKKKIIVPVGEEEEGGDNNMVGTRAKNKIRRNHYRRVNQRSYIREFGNRDRKVWVTKGQTIGAAATGAGTGNRTQAGSLTRRITGN